MTTKSSPPLTKPYNSDKKDKTEKTNSGDLKAFPWILSMCPLHKTPLKMYPLTK